MWRGVRKWMIGDWRLETKTPSLKLFIIIAALLSSCISTPPVIKIGLVAPFEGRQREIGYDVIYSARLAVRAINEAGGINGQRVALVALDDGGNVKFARETAVSLTLDPAVVAVIGHWTPETTAVAQPIYADAQLPFIPITDSSFPPEQLPAEFHTAYEAVTPFDETAGEFSGTAYDAMQWLSLVLSEAETENGRIVRQTVADSLSQTKYEGVTGSWELNN